jgi:putative transposase
LATKKEKENRTMGKATTKQNKGKGLKIVNKQDSNQLRAALAKNGQLLLPFVELISQSQIAIDELIDMAGRATIEALLLLSAEQVAGPKRQGQRKGERREVGWYGSQTGRVSLAERKLQVAKPRLRTRGAGGKEVEIPAYTALQDDSRLSRRIFEILMAGVSTRKYQEVLPQMADTVGVAKSSISAEFIEASAAQLKALSERRFEGVKLMVIYLDGIVIASHHVLVAVGVDENGAKHVLGLTAGASENEVVAKTLLEDLVGRGVGTQARRLFVIDGSKALRAAIKKVFGHEPAVQRCRAHKMRNVIGHLPLELQSQVQAVMRAAYKLPYAEGIARLKKQADWLSKEYPAAAASLLEGLEETFTVNKLGLTPKLMRALSTTNIIENPNGTARRSLNRVARWRNGEMVLRWAAATFLTAEKRFRRIAGHQELWVLKAALSQSADLNQLDSMEASA